MRSREFTRGNLLLHSQFILVRLLFLFHPTPTIDSGGGFRGRCACSIPTRTRAPVDGGTTLLDTEALSVGSRCQWKGRRRCAEVFLGHRAREQDDNLLFVRERLLNTRVDRATMLSLYARVLVRDDSANTTITELRLSGICKVARGQLHVRRTPSQRKVAGARTGHERRLRFATATGHPS